MKRATGKAPRCVSGATCILADHQVTVREGELLRAISATLGCPMPPLTGRQVEQVAQILSSAHATLIRGGLKGTKHQPRIPSCRGLIQLNSVAGRCQMEQRIPAELDPAMPSQYPFRQTIQNE